jgi:hypothetical protein
MLNTELGAGRDVHCEYLRSVFARPNKACFALFCAANPKFRAFCAVLRVLPALFSALKFPMINFSVSCMNLTNIFILKFLFKIFTMFVSVAKFF